MTGELGAVGEAATGGLIAGAIERPDAHKIIGGPCANCGATLQGAFCHVCGQPGHVHHSLWHMLEETLHGLFHFDTKTWRTLPKLAFRPGTLTREYLDGKRARYVSPLGLFLFTVFLTFAVMAFAGGVSLAGFAHMTVNGKDMSDPQARAAALAELQREHDQAVHDGDTAGAEGIQNTITLINTMQSSNQALGERLVQAAQRGDLHFTTGNPALDAKVQERLRNPDLLFYKIEQTAYKFAFLLIPISLPMIALLFLWKRGFTWFDHTVFALYSLSFMSIFFLIMALITPTALHVPALRVARGAMLAFVPPAHMFSQLRGAYKLGTFSALWRTFALLFFCLIALSIFITLILIVGLLD
ncbi:MAG: DUF3667 domain-containing protein [Pseudomonadota bacterium]